MMGRKYEDDATTEKKGGGGGGSKVGWLVVSEVDL